MGTEEFIPAGQTILENIVVVQKNPHFEERRTD